MGWTSGKFGKPYYIFQEWQNGRLVRRYAGKGQIGEKVQRERREAREAERRLKDEFLELEELTRQYENLAKEYMHETLTARGYVYNWRRWYLATSMRGKRK